MPKTAPTPPPAAERLVVVLAYDGLCTFEFGCAVEIFGLPRPEMGPHWYRFAVAGIEAGPLRAVGGVTVGVDGGLDLVLEAGTVIVPGWRGRDAPVPERLCAALRGAHAAGARVVSLCSGAYVLAAAGLLDGRRATTHWQYGADLAARYPALTFVPDVLYVDSGSVLTAAGSAAGIDLCLHLVRRDHGTAAANRVARRLVVPGHRSGAQVQVVETPVPCDRGAGVRLGAVMERVRGRLDDPWPIARLASAAGLSGRALHRHFRAMTGQSPAAWLVGERLGRAQRLLEETALPVAAIAAACGLTTASLQHHFRARLGTGPAAYRAGRAQPPA